MSLPWRPVDGGLEVALKVTPRAPRALVAGPVVEADGNAWVVAKVTAAAEGGRANAAVLGLLAGALGVPPSACDLVAGAASRRKRVRVRGDPAELARGLAARLAGA